MPERPSPAPGAVEAGLATLLGLLDHGVLLVDREFAVALVNPALVRILGLGLEPEQLIGARLPAGPASLPHAYAEPDRVLGDTRHRLAAARPVRGDRYPLADGRLVEHDYAPVTGAGATEGHLWLVREVPGGAEPAAQAQAGAGPARGAGVATGASEFATTVAHELRTPAATVAAAAELLEEPAWAVATVRRGAERLRLLAADLLLLADLEGGPDQAADTPVDLAGLTRAAVSTLAETGRPVRLLIEPAGPAEPGSGGRPAGANAAAPAPARPAGTNAAAPGPVLLGDPHLIRQALAAILAVTGALTEGALAVRVRGAGRGPWWVSATGEIPVDQPVTRERLLAVQVPRGRGEEPGRTAALALRLARAVARRQHGDLTTSITAGNCTITLSLSSST